MQQKVIQQRTDWGNLDTNTIYFQLCVGLLPNKPMKYIGIYGYNMI